MMSSVSVSLIVGARRRLAREKARLQSSSGRHYSTAQNQAQEGKFILNIIETVVDRGGGGSYNTSPLLFLRDEFSHT